jgi:hypothetical protein
MPIEPATLGNHQPFKVPIKASCSCFQARHYKISDEICQTKMNFPMANLFHTNIIMHREAGPYPVNILTYSCMFIPFFLYFSKALLLSLP